MEDILSCLVKATSASLSLVLITQNAQIQAFATKIKVLVPIAFQVTHVTLEANASFFKLIKPQSIQNVLIKMS
jgi:hypothetical protein